MNAKHTATPYRTNGQEIFAENGDIVARVCEYGPQSETPDAQARNAAFIVRTCNAHDDLVRALQDIARNDPYNQSSAGIIARDALSKVGAA